SRVPGRMTAARWGAPADGDPGKGTSMKMTGLAPRAAAEWSLHGRIDRRRAAYGLAGGLATLALAACGEMPSPAAKSDADATEAAALGVSITVVPGESTEPLEGAKLVVESGKPSPTELTLKKTDATVLRVVNRDDAAYQVSIANLVDQTSIAPKTTTILGFTSPDSGRYDGYLYAADGGDPIGQFTVDVTTS
ncbi:MAG TPA: cupredoxin domain-containing protein, partial [Thermomicrobiales bacterium]|nr:cupredoxin domain-containing protein [Thermomicrobiales bacterium]